MLSEQWQDLAISIAFTVFIFLGIIVFIIPSESVSFDEDLELSGEELNDELLLFSFNLLRTNIGDVKVSDLISVYDKDKFNDVGVKANQINRLVYNKDYAIKANYPDGKSVIVATNLVEGSDPEETLEIYGKYFEDLEVKFNYKLPYIEDGIIIVEVLA